MIIVCHDYEDAGSLVALNVRGGLVGPGLGVHSSVGGARARPVEKRGWRWDLVTSRY